jgi:hypothetical protein
MTMVSFFSFGRGAARAETLRAKSPAEEEEEEDEEEGRGRGGLSCPLVSFASCVSKGRGEGKEGPPLATLMYFGAIL